MTKEQALHKFWNSFGLSAYEETSTPDGMNRPTFPYMTYQLVTDAWGAEHQTAVNLWYRSESWVGVNSKKDEISAAIGEGGKIIPCDGGYIWIKRGSPFAQNVREESDDLVKRKYLNFAVEFLTAN